MYTSNYDSLYYAALTDIFERFNNTLFFNAKETAIGVMAEARHATYPLYYESQIESPNRRQRRVRQSRKLCLPLVRRRHIPVDNVLEIVLEIIREIMHIAK